MAVFFDSPLESEVDNTNKDTPGSNKNNNVA